MKLNHVLKINGKLYYAGTPSQFVGKVEIVEAKTFKNKEEALKIVEILLNQVFISCIEIVDIYTA